MFEHPEYDNKLVNVLCHSIGCIQALKVQSMLRAKFGREMISAIVYLGAPLAESPTLGINPVVSEWLDSLK